MNEDKIKELEERIKQLEQRPIYYQPIIVKETPTYYPTRPIYCWCGRNYPHSCITC